MKIWPRARAEMPAMAVAATPIQEEADSEGMAPRERWIGYVDRIDRNSIQGWCADLDNPAASVAVEAVGSRGSRSVAIASLFRRDVMERGYGSGHYGFELTIADFGDDETVTIRFVDDGREITQAPIALDPVGALLSNPLPEAYLEAAQDLARSVEAQHLLQIAEPAPPPIDEPYDERLLESFDAVADPEGLVTRFTAQEASRLNRTEFDLDRTGSLQDRLGVLLWYVDTYASGRPVSARVPLGRGQIAALNAPAPLAGASEAVTVALLNFVLSRRPTHVQLCDEHLLREAVFWWCTQQAVLHRLDDRLVTPAQVALLGTVERGAGSQFPCTTFMLLYARHLPELAALDLGLPRDRLALLAYLVLASFLRPGLLRFLPREALRSLSRGKDDGMLAAILGRLAMTGDEADRAVLGADLLRKGEDLLAAAGQSLRLPRRSVPAAAAAPAPQPGVCVVGPLSKSSGLGRAMRLSLDALAVCEGEPPAAYDFGMDNPAAESGDRTPRSPPTTRREITLLHLNAEALPLALAYGPRPLLAGTYRIGFFFWELTEIPECHRLALDLVDEIWVASEFDREVYARATTKPVIRVGMAAPQLPDVSAAPRAEWGLEPDVFTFISVFDSLSFIARKNPLGMIEAFARAFPRGDEPVALVLKTQNRGVIQDEWQVRIWRAIDRGIAADPRVILIDETLGFADLLALMRACDAFVSLHRAEGWGFGIVEAMQLGLPVVCTGWSGNVDFCTDETAFLVEHRLIAVGADEYIHAPRGSLWAEPSVEAAATQMRIVATDRALADRKTRAARSFVAEHLGLDATARRYGARLAAIRDQRTGAAG